MNCVFVLFLSTLTLVMSIPIDNGIVGEPEIQCGPYSVIINFNTENTFGGKIYVKNFFDDNQCLVRAGGRDGGRDRFGSIELPFETCGVRRERSANPRGIFVSSTVIISFHETFITKIDRAIRFQCFYMEADKTVSQELEVSMLTTELQTLQVPMPVCRYDILDGGPNGEPVRFTTIGQQVYHKWTCDTDTTDTFCMVVYDCMVDDGSGDKIQLLDQDGCALDRYLLGNLEYPTDLMGGREAHVFKYADRANLYFNCQIRITIKEPGSQCDRPQCRDRRRKRSSITPAAVVDVSTPHAVMVADVDLKGEDIPNSLLHPRHGLIHVRPAVSVRDVENDGYCLSGAGLGVLLAVGVLFIVSTLTMTVSLLARKNEKSIV